MRLSQDVRSSMEKMVSQSRIAQGQLAQLEKQAAPFADQLAQAAQFIGVELELSGGTPTDGVKRRRLSGPSSYHGKEEWLLKWLLKRLQVAEDDTPRRTLASWLLLSHLLETIPRVKIAQILGERAFALILRMSLEDIRKSSVASARRPISNDVADGNEKKSSKKRKRSGDTAMSSSAQQPDLPTLLSAVYQSVSLIVQTTDANSALEEGRNAAFTAEYMGIVTKTTAEEAARILGAWLSLCQQAVEDKAQFDMAGWLAPFIEIWDSHVRNPKELGQFEAHCTVPALSLLQIPGAGKFSAPGNWKRLLEKLIARNIMIPARVAEESDPKLLSTLTKASVIKDTNNCPLLFEIAIRSIQQRGNRRRPAEEAWLQTAFDILGAAVPATKRKETTDHITTMITSAIDHKLSLKLSDLRKIALKFGLPEGSEDWHLIAMVIRLDSNVFLIPENNFDLLERLLRRITTASLEPSWAQTSDHVVLEVLVPLMREFARARDLSGFVHHWFSQLVAFETLRKQASRVSDTLLSAWEDQALHDELKKLLEPSLTLHQIEQILDWLSPQAAENPNASCVILEALAGSISREENVDAIGVRLAHTLAQSFDLAGPDARYKWRSWRVLSQPIGELDFQSHDLIAKLWEERSKPFNQIARFETDNLNNEDRAKTLARLESIESLRFLCASWACARTGSKLEVQAKPILLDMFAGLADEITGLPGLLKSGVEMGNEKCGSRLSTLNRGLGWQKWSALHCIFEEYPKVLELGLELKGRSFKDMLQSIFWTASASAPTISDQSKNSWLELNSKAFQNLWLSSLRQNAVLNNKSLIELITEIMLNSITYTKSPFTNSKGNNAFAIRALLELPLEVVLKPTREQILKAWELLSINDSDEAPGDISTRPNPLDPAVLSLKIKTMQNPMIHDDMVFEKFIQLADILADKYSINSKVELDLLTELARLTLTFVCSNIDHSRNKVYLKKAFRQIQKRVRKAGEKKKHRPNFAVIAIFGTSLCIIKERWSESKHQIIIDKDDLDETIANFKSNLLLQLKDTLNHYSDEDSTTKDLLINSIIGAMNDLGFENVDFGNFQEDVKEFIGSETAKSEIKMRLGTFLQMNSLRSAKVQSLVKLENNLTTSYGRQSVLQVTRAATSSISNQERFVLLGSLFDKWPETASRLDILLAAKEVIMSIDDMPKSEESSRPDFDLSFAYSLLCGQLAKTPQTQHFSLIIDILDILLTTKSHSMTQFNIDMTLGSITTICSRNSPVLPSERAGDIYLKLCHLVHSILNNHRLKLEGHFHLVVQLLITLLRCLFTPLTRVADNEQFGAPPTWLRSPNHQLDATHADAFARLITMICNPSVSSVRTAKHNALSSVTDKAKRMAGQHIKYLFMAYIKMQLEMRMLSEIREKMKPALYSIFDTTTLDSRRGITDSLDASGRAVYGELFRDYMNFGKWKGN